MDCPRRNRISLSVIMVAGFLGPAALLWSQVVSVSLRAEVQRTLGLIDDDPLRSFLAIRDQQGARQYLVDLIDRCAPGGKIIDLTCRLQLRRPLLILGQIGDQRALPRSIALLRNNSFTFHEASLAQVLMEAAAKLDVEKSTDALLGFYEATDAPYLRGACAQKLGRYSKSRAVAAKLEAFAAKEARPRLKQDLLGAAAAIRAQATH